MAAFGAADGSVDRDLRGSRGSILSYFLDASALAKRIVRERGTDFVEALAETDILISRLTTVEVVSALERRHREGGLSVADRSRTLEYLRGLFDRILIGEVTAAICLRATRLLARHSIRAADAVQLASALELATELGPDLPFVAFDRRLRGAAEAEGLEILPPDER